MHFSRSLYLGLALTLSGTAFAQLAVSEGGTPTFAQAIAVPPGIAGMAPKIGLYYAGGGVNGPVGHGWSVQGLSSITRCPAATVVDGRAVPVSNAPSDKLCLDGQRLIQTDASGAAKPFPQTNDAAGLPAGGFTEFRTEKDTYARIRAYGYANGDTSGQSGPAYFKVWTKSGQVYEYGDSPSKDSNTKALITPWNKTVGVAWAVSRINDTLGNFIDFKYEQRDVAWGSDISTTPATLGHEWNLLEIQYSGNKVVFNYADRASRTPQDSAEAYHQGSKNVSIRLLQSITTYVNSPNTTSLGPAAGASPAVAVKTVKLTYGAGPSSGRSVLTKIQECAGAPSSVRCLPGTVFTYSAGGGEAYAGSAAFQNSSLPKATLSSLDGKYGVLAGDFDGDGKTDFIRWSDTPSENQMYLSNGDGTFRLLPNGSGAGQFNLTSQNLFKSDQCYMSIGADFNGDGITDILRIMRANSKLNVSCGTVTNTLYLGNGDGSFSAVNVPTIDFSQTQSKRTVQYNCLVPASSTYIAGCQEPGDTYLGTSQTWGANFHLVDVNGDGLLDIVTTILPGFSTTTTPPTEAAQCASIVCTRVFLGSTNGTFTEFTGTNLVHRSTYADLATRIDWFRKPYVADVNGDGLADLMVQSGVWISRGDGNFDPGPAGSSTVGCANPIDFNGDGRADCLGLWWDDASKQTMTVSDGTYAPKNVANFNLKSVGQELMGFAPGTQSQSIGIVVADINGDGRQDIIRWKDDPSKNALYLSNGDGTFTASTAFAASFSGVTLRKSDGSFDFIVGDFTGRGAVEILRLGPVVTSGGENDNRLYVKTNATPPDQLISVMSPSGATTTLYYVPLTSSTPQNGVSASYGPRYTSDRLPQVNPWPIVNLSIPMNVVATSVADSGVGSKTIATEYSYYGLKAEINGRGMLGFREVRRQSPSPSLAADPLTVSTQYLLTHPYIGVAKRTDTYNAALNAIAPSSLLSSTVNVYCDQTRVDGAEASATLDSPCQAQQKIQRPYLYKSTETGIDLAGVALPQVVTVNTFNGTGDLTKAVVTTTGTAAGIAQTFRKTTDNVYQADDTSCTDFQTCRWSLARLTQAKVTNEVPNSLASISTSAGTAPGAAATAGTGPVGTTPLTPAQVSTIMMLLMDD